MHQRLPLTAFPKAALGGLSAIERHLHSRLDRKLLELIKLRASQINGCAYCIDMHAKEARDAGETEQRLHGLAAWREAPYYTDRERALLAWTEAVTRLDREDVDDATWERVRQVLDEGEIADWTVAIIAINAWNRWNVALRTEAGGYEVGMFG